MPPSRWLEEARILYQEHPDGLHLTYDPKLRDAVIDGFKNAGDVDAWPCLRRFTVCPRPNPWCEF